MRYRNSSAYVQWMIDKVLWEQHEFAQAYMNNIVIFLSTLNEHLQYLDSIFKMLSEKNICLFSKKSFLDYLSVKLLSQRVDTLRLTTVMKKLTAIIWLKFSRSLSSLKRYLDLTEYLWQYILKYAVISKSLQEWKTLLNKALNKQSDKAVKGMTRKKMIKQVKIKMLTLKKLQVFDQLQALFSQPIILVHFDSVCQLYVDLDTFKEYSFRAHVYHCRSDSEIKTDSTLKTKQKNIKSICFLSRLLINTETRYWSTELKVADLVWVIQKIQHMIESVIKVTIIYTDHSAMMNIVHQLSLLTTFTEKINLQLI